MSHLGTLQVLTKESANNIVWLHNATGAGVIKVPSHIPMPCKREKEKIIRLLPRNPLSGTEKKAKESNS